MIEYQSVPHSLLDSRGSKELRRHLFDELDGHGISITGKSGITEGIRNFFRRGFHDETGQFRGVDSIATGMG